MNCEHCYGCNYLLDTAKLSKRISERRLSILSIVCTWWSSLKANWHLITIIIKTILVATIKNLTSAMSVVLTILSDLKKGH